MNRTHYDIRARDRGPSAERRRLLEVEPKRKRTEIREADYGGINANASIMKAMAISGALSGLGGALHIMGNAMHVAQFAGQEGFGFQGITVALIAGSNPIGCIFSGLFYGAMKYGGLSLTLTGAPKEVMDIIMGTIVLFIAITHVFKSFVQKRQQKKRG